MLLKVDEILSEWQTALIRIRRRVTRWMRRRVTAWIRMRRRVTGSKLFAYGILVVIGGLRVNFHWQGLTAQGFRSERA